LRQALENDPARLRPFAPCGQCVGASARPWRPAQAAVSQLAQANCADKSIATVITRTAKHERRTCCRAALLAEPLVCCRSGSRSGALHECAWWQGRSRTRFEGAQLFDPIQCMHCSFFVGPTPTVLCAGAAHSCQLLPECAQTGEFGSSHPALRRTRQPWGQIDSRQTKHRVQDRVCRRFHECT